MTEEHYLLSKQKIKLHSGSSSDFKIDCDALTEKDLECIAYLISKKVKFGSVVGVPTGGDRLAGYLSGYSGDSSLPTLICDDVLTTGNSMEKMKSELGQNDIIGVVIFARNQCPDWIIPLFQML